jgi:hypothetical protein
MPMTSPKPTWAKRFRELLAGHIAALGDANVTPAKRATIRSAVVLQMELEVLSRRFALRGTGASAADLTLFSKISSAMTGMFASVGLGGHEVNIVNHHNVAVRIDDGRQAAEAIEQALTKLILARQRREADGLVIDVQPNEPVDHVEAEPGHVEPQVIHDDPKPLRIVRASPQPPASVDRPKTATELYFESGNSQSPWWGPIGSGGKPP